MLHEAFLDTEPEPEPEDEPDLYGEPEPELELPMGSSLSNIFDTDADPDSTMVEPPTSDDSQPLPIRGLTHDEVLNLEVEHERYLITDLIPAAAVGTIAGLPETHKSWLAQAIAVRVAHGHGEILGCNVSASARVGYFWSDDSTREEAERIKLFHSVEQAPNDLSLWWFLNSDLELPAGCERLIATVKQHRLDLVILDSFYNFARGVDLKDEGAEQIVALLKRQVADATGCTVLLVDHMPWATDTNRQRLRAYGGVFKNAATRFGIYIDAQGSKLWIEARGNNIRGFKRTPAYWDTDTLNLRLADDTPTIDDEEFANAVLAWVTDHPGEPQSAVENEVKGGRTRVRNALEAWRALSMLATGPGRASNGKYWYPSNHAALSSPGEQLATTGDHTPDAPLDGSARPLAPSPIRASTSGERAKPDVEQAEIDRLYEEHSDIAEATP